MLFLITHVLIIQKSLLVLRILLLRLLDVMAAELSESKILTCCLENILYMLVQQIAHLKV